MGVSGSGKSVVGAGLARRLGVPFIEGDQLHPPANVAKMSAGTPLDDADRWPWLDAVGAALGEAARAHGVAVAGCSALKRVYRNRLRDRAGVPLVFVLLNGTHALLAERLKARKGHFMPPSLLESQLRTLETPGADENAIMLDIAKTPEALVEEAVRGVEGRRG